VLAQEEARLLGHEFAGAEHLLLGITREGEGVAAQALGQLGVGHERLRAHVIRAKGEGAGSPSGHMSLSPAAKRALELSLRESLERGHNYIGAEHLLLGLLREGESFAVLILRELGAEPASLRAQVLELMVAPGSVGPTAEAPLPPPQPRCPGCGIALEAALGARVLAAAGDGDSGEDDVAVTVVYCRACERALGTFPAS